MFQFSAPYPTLQTTSLLAEPGIQRRGGRAGLRDAEDGDGRHAVHLRQATRNGRKKLTWQFKLTRNKALEFQAFICAYFASQVYGDGPFRPDMAGQLHEQPV